MHAQQCQRENEKEIDRTYPATHEKVTTYVFTTQTYGTKAAQKSVSYCISASTHNSKLIATDK